MWIWAYLHLIYFPILHAILDCHYITKAQKRMFEIEALDPPKATVISTQMSSSSLSDFPFKSTSDIFEDEPNDLTQITVHQLSRFTSEFTYHWFPHEVEPFSIIKLLHRSTLHTLDSQFIKCTQVAPLNYTTSTLICLYSILKWLLLFWISNPRSSNILAPKNFWYWTWHIFCVSQDAPLRP